jgi:hypothetical protein
MRRLRVLRWQAAPAPSPRSPRRGHDPDRDPGSPIDDRVAVDENFILTVVPANRIYFDRELTAEPRRHTDSMYPRNSERAVANRYPGHGDLLADLARDEPEGCTVPPWSASTAAVIGSNYLHSPEYQAGRRHGCESAVNRTVPNVRLAAAREFAFEPANVSGPEGGLR